MYRTEKNEHSVQMHIFFRGFESNCLPIGVTVFPEDSEFGVSSFEI